MLPAKAVLPKMVPSESSEQLSTHHKLDAFHDRLLWMALSTYDEPGSPPDSSLAAPGEDHLLGGSPY
jgi:hypothetical protein